VAAPSVRPWAIVRRHQGRAPTHRRVPLRPWRRPAAPGERWWPAAPAWPRAATGFRSLSAARST